jgi:2-polyprenyl-6-methoxyphenol hydroxylase-like FAD-dependent oxidoreductase
LLKQWFPECAVRVFERHKEGAVPGWGVTLYLEALDAFDKVTAREIRDCCFTWTQNVVHVQGRRPISVDTPGHSIGRGKLMEILVKRARDLGVQIEFESEIEDVGRLRDHDLVIAGDGVGSATRARLGHDLGTMITRGSNKYIWLGTPRVFDAFTFPFVHTDAGWLWAYAYGFSRSMSTFIVELSADTWRKLKLDTRDTQDSLKYLSELFGEWLQGEPLMLPMSERGKPFWLEFQTVTNRKWYSGNVALLGDAAHTTHYTIGSGTRLAIADACSLASSLRSHSTVPDALAAYDKERQESISEFQSTARLSAEWFENLERYITDRDPESFTKLLYARSNALMPHLPPAIFLKLQETSKKHPFMLKWRNALQGLTRSA